MDLEMDMYHTIVHHTEDHKALLVKFRQFLKPYFDAATDLDTNRRAIYYLRRIKHVKFWLDEPQQAPQEEQQ